MELRGMRISFPMRLCGISPRSSARRTVFAETPSALAYSCTERYEALGARRKRSSHLIDSGIAKSPFAIKHRGMKGRVQTPAVAAGSPCNQDPLVGRRTTICSASEAGVRLSISPVIDLLPSVQLIAYSPYRPPARRTTTLLTAIPGCIHAVS